jgi:hypothetical protein
VYADLAGNRTELRRVFDSKVASVLQGLQHHPDLRDHPVLRWNAA